ncbi:MAG: hypothetical protein HY459_04365, partial [Parcubacteria group bacterium]|nr:hypothetical protein [Parcubacteria group bacterium]
MSTNPRVEGLWTMRVGEREASLKALEEAIVKHGGEPVLIFDRLRSDAAFTQRVAKLLLRDGIESSIHHKLARAVMSYNFWGAEEWSSFFGVNFTKKQLREVKEFPWSLDVLNSTCPLCGNRVRDCHFAFVGLDRI